MSSSTEIAAPVRDGVVAHPRTVRDAIDRGLIDDLIGRVRADRAAQRVTTYAPFTGAPIAELPQTSPAAVQRAVARARQVQPAWAAWTPRQRARVLQALYDRVLGRQAQVLDLIQIETGKARAHAFDEVVDIALCRLCRGRVRRDDRVHVSNIRSTMWRVKRPPRSVENT